MLGGEANVTEGARVKRMPFSNLESFRVAFFFSAEANSWGLVRAFIVLLRLLLLIIIIIIIPIYI